MDEFKFSTFRFSFDSGELIGGSTKGRLEPKASAVLKTLCARRGQVVSRQDLLDQCWGEGLGSDEALSQAIAQIRRGLEKVGQSASLIETRAKVGYRLNAPSDGEPKPTRSNRPIYAAIAAVAAAVLVIFFVQPHALKHFIRHSLGLYRPH